MNSGLPKSYLELSIQWQKFFPPSELITLKTTSEEIAEKISQVEQRLEFFDAMVKSLETTDGANKASHMKYVTPVRIKIWQSSICQDFSDRYLGLVGALLNGKQPRLISSELSGRLMKGLERERLERSLGL